ncbi:hypothetical protein BCY89_26655 [Sphingobacterium siyangense]|uniref:Uncharacterized protein n=1 Tax=Sphingobacterium siyangense TaxID=459529 RepID=A0A420G174_9SPHI|nr:hypothetical protein [Sphingobacterium siyangense]RKF38930.1 hypothetical protein BCY89_26655 [Sphingobacterium siyangense]
MENTLNIIEKYDLLVSTLNMILVPPKESGVLYEEKVRRSLEELEGDYYSFLNQTFIEELHQSNVISRNGVVLLIKIRSAIEDLDQFKWNVEDFLTDNNWYEIRNFVIKVFLSELK